MREMACWHRDLGWLAPGAFLKCLIYTAAFEDPSAGPRELIHAEFYKGSRKSFRVNEDLQSFELPLMLSDRLSRWAKQRKAMA